MIKGLTDWSSLLLISLLYRFEISVGLIDYFKIRECIRVLGKNLLEIIELMLIDNTDQHCFSAACVRADCLNFSASVMKVFGDLFHKFLSV